jgi:hypothetical protein
MQLERGSYSLNLVLVEAEGEALNHWAEKQQTTQWSPLNNLQRRSYVYTAAQSATGT